MHSVTGSKKNTIQNLIPFIGETIGRVFRAKDLQEILSDLVAAGELSASGAKKIRSRAHRLDGDWRNWRGPLLDVFDQPTDFLDVLEGLCRAPGFYLSHQSALYLHGLVEQRPHTYFVTQEKKGKVVPESPPLNEFVIRQELRKPPRLTTNAFKTLNHRILLLEKPWLAEPEVHRLTIRREDREILLPVTGIERTLVDAVMAPHLVGGARTLIESFRNCAFDREKLLFCYRALDPKYPFWQSIGFLLQRDGRLDDAEWWKKRFSKIEKIEFYLDREPNLTWPFSREWMLHYPPEVAR